MAGGGRAGPQGEEKLLSLGHQGRQASHGCCEEGGLQSSGFCWACPVNGVAQCEVDGAGVDEPLEEMMRIRIRMILSHH